jgi:hypothetical protein
MNKAVFLAVLLSASPAVACHRFSRWAYPWPQRCAVARVQLPVSAPAPPVKPDAPTDNDIPLPSLDRMEFPPDPPSELLDRLKGIGLLRQLRGTN